MPDQNQPSRADTLRNIAEALAEAAPHAGMPDSTHADSGP